jgi:hypothetical protein
MAALSDADRKAVWTWLMRRGAFPPNITKAQLRAAVDAVDSTLDGLAGTFNAALPEPFKSAATSEQKAIILGVVGFKRGGLL